MQDPTPNTFLTGRLPVIFAKTAIPIIFVMSMNGLLTVADALFLGHFVGPQALAAVTVVFPFYMLIVACATLVSAGMSSLLARHLGGSRFDEAERIYAAAHWLALVVGGILILLYLGFGGQLIWLVTGGDSALAELSASYLGILIFATPLTFVLAVNSDALRNEGHVGMMAAMSLLVSIGNIGFNYLMIAVLDLGVAGSAYGTVEAQLLALGVILAYRHSRGTLLHPVMVLRNVILQGSGRILALGAPQSLGFIGIALGSSAILTALQMVGSPDYEVTVTAYGIVTRVVTFAFLPLLGVSQAMQTITGNNFGAGLWQRSDNSLQIAVLVALGFCLSVQAVFSLFAPQIAAAFVTDPAVVAKVAAIMPVMLALFVLSGPLMMLAAHFQAIGDARRAAVLSLSKPFAFAIPLTFALPLWFGEMAIWWAGPAAEVLLLLLVVWVLWTRARRTRLSWGVFTTTEEARS